MDVMQFHRMRRAMQVSVSPGAHEELVSVEQSLRDLLMRSGVFEEVEVEHTDDPDQLVIALCKFDPGCTEAEVATRLTDIWSERVSSPFWEAHVLSVEREHVEFEAATRMSSRGGYVTVHLVAQKARIPSQRGSAD